MTIRISITAIVAAATLGLAGCSAPTATPPGITAPTTGAAAPGSRPNAGEVDAANWSAVAEKVTPAVVAVSVRTANAGGQGSGVIIDDQGHIVTNHHVVAGQGAEIFVTLWDNRVLPAQLVGSDPATDLAVLKVDGAQLTPIPIGNDRDLQVGDPVLAVGNPLGLAGTVTSGMVSALNRPVSTSPGGRTSGGEPTVTNAIQTDAAINPGNSGGALINGAGELVGINSSIASMGEQAGSIGIGFAITATQMRNIVEQLLETGRAEHSYLGVVVADSIARVGEVGVRAAGIARVEPDTPAARAGLRQGDSVTKIDGEEVDSGLSLTAQVRERKAGAEVKLSVARDGAITEIPVTLARRP